MRTAIRLTQAHFHDVAGHFLALSRRDRLLRFGLEMSDVQIVAYVDSLFASNDSAFVVVEPNRDVSGALHLESMGFGVTVGLSVSSWARSLGIGTLLLERAAATARARGIKALFVRNLNGNTGLQQVALRAGMTVVCAPNALITQLEVPAANDHSVDCDGFAGKITLADDSLRPQWNGRWRDAPMLELPEPVLL